VSGLVGSGLAIANNNGVPATIPSDGAYVLASVASGGTYSLQVAGLPRSPTQACSITNGSGSVANANIANVRVVCATSSFTVGGTVAALAGTGLSIALNGGAPLPIGADGAFTFPGRWASGAAFSAAIHGQPAAPAQLCSIHGGSGTVTDRDVTSISVLCDSGHRVGGYVSGMLGSGLVLSNGRGATLPVTGNASFQFPGRLLPGENFTVRASSQPGSPTQICAAKDGSGSGSMGSTDIDTVLIECVAPRPNPLISLCNDESICAAQPPAVLRVCPSSTPNCSPVRSTSAIFRLDGTRLLGELLLVDLPNGYVLSADGANVTVLGYNMARISGTSWVSIASDVDISLSYYRVAPVWGGTTLLEFESVLSVAPTVQTVFYRHESYSSAQMGATLQAHAVGAVAAERSITGLGARQLRAYFIPTEMVTQGEGNFSYGNGEVTINYGNPPYIDYRGGIIQTAIPRFAHEYAHDLFTEVQPRYGGNPNCLNEGLADALAYVSGYLPLDEFGPIGLHGKSFELDGCPVMTEIHDVGNCPLWHVYKAGLLTPSFMRALFHPQHSYSFDSCNVVNPPTGNALFVLYTEAAGGANVAPALAAAGIQHAATYAAAKAALGF
jgi:hypothetical protein